MKEFNKLTEKEIVKLTNDQLENYYKLELAKTGIPIMESPEAPEYQEKPKADINLFKSNVFEKIYCTDENVMKEINVLLQKNWSTIKTVETKYYGDEKNIFVHPEPRAEYSSRPLVLIVEPSEGYSNKLLSKVNEVSTKNKTLKDKYDITKNTFKEFDEKKTECRNIIYGKFNELRTKFYEIDRHIDRFSEYMNLASNKFNTALDFYKKAFTIDEETEMEITNEYGKKKA